MISLTCVLVVVAVDVVVVGCGVVVFNCGTVTGVIITVAPVPSLTGHTLGRVQFTHSDRKHVQLPHPALQTSKS